MKCHRLFTAVLVSAGVFLPTVAQAKPSPLAEAWRMVHQEMRVSVPRGWRETPWLGGDWGTITCVNPKNPQQKEVIAFGGGYSAYFYQGVFHPRYASFMAEGGQNMKAQVSLRRVTSDIWLMEAKKTVRDGLVMRGIAFADKQQRTAIGVTMFAKGTLSPVQNEILKTARFI